jgi:uncharacterized protein YdeI (YjbR/CyaY-like superfamily)
VEAIYFESAVALRRWLEEHHDRATELLVGFHRKSSGRQGIGYEEAVLEALCFGWIDGITRRVDPTRYAIRFTPRKPRSNWSQVNVGRVEDLVQQGRMTPAGLRAYEARDRTRPAYSYEQRSKPFEPALEETFRRERRAWSFFEAQPPSYRHMATFWVMSAKREETRLRRLMTLIEHSARGERLPMLTSPTRRSPAERSGSRV